MEELTFKIKQGIRTGNPEVDEYIDSLHQHLLSFDTSNIKKLILSLDKIAGVLSEDIEMVISGEDWIPEPTEILDEEGYPTVSLDTGRSRLRILSDSKDSKVFERVMTLVQRVKDLDAVAKTAKALLPEVEEWTERQEKEVKEVVKIASGGNSFEQAQEHHFKKRQGKTIV